MPQIPVASSLGYVGVFLLLAGFFLLLTGLNIVKIEKITVAPGSKTWGFGIILAVLGVVFLVLDVWVPPQPSTPTPIVEVPTPTATPTHPTNTPVPPTHTPTAEPPTSIPIPGPTNTNTPTLTPAPTQTPTPTRILTPTPIPLVRGELLFEDNFNDAMNGWNLEPNRFWIADGLYHISLNKGQANHVFPANYFEWRNFVYEAAFHEVEGNGSYSLLFRAHHPGKHGWERLYSFEVISNEQIYNVERVDFTAGNTGSDWPSPLMWRGYVPSIDKQATSHTLTVVARDNQFTFYIDDQFISTLVDEDDLYQKGTIGLAVESAHITVDYVRVWALPQ